MKFDGFFRYVVGSIVGNAALSTYASQGFEVLVWLHEVTIVNNEQFRFSGNAMFNYSFLMSPTVEFIPSDYKDWHYKVLGKVSILSDGKEMFSLKIDIKN